MSLRSAINLILQQLGDVEFIVHDEVLQITSETRAEREFQTRVYRVDMLADWKSGRQRGIKVTGDGSGPSAWPDYDAVIDAITQSIDPQTWTENGTGDGSIDILPWGILVISHTRQVHAKVERLLDDLRRVTEDIQSDKIKSDDDTHVE